MGEGVLRVVFIFFIFMMSYVVHDVDLAATFDENPDTRLPSLLHGQV